MLKHGHILEFLDAVLVEEHTGFVPGLFVLLELAAGGDLFDKIGACLRARRRAAKMDRQLKTPSLARAAAPAEAQRPTAASRTTSHTSSSTSSCRASCVLAVHGLVVCCCHAC
jgi:hypothetical protein